MNPEKQELDEIRRVTLENNRILHAMRRNAFWGGLIKFLFYIFVLVVAPLWIYTTYLQPLVQNMQQTLGWEGGSAQVQFGNLQEMWKQVETQFRDRP